MIEGWLYNQSLSMVIDLEPQISNVGGPN